MKKKLEKSFRTLENLLLKAQKKSEDAKETTTVLLDSAFQSTEEKIHNVIQSATDKVEGTDKIIEVLAVQTTQTLAKNSEKSIDQLDETTGTLVKHNAGKLKAQIKEKTKEAGKRSSGSFGKISKKLSGKIDDVGKPLKNVEETTRYIH